MNKRICAAIFGVLWAAGALAQTSTITEVVVQGNKGVTTEAILARMRTKVGQPYVQAQLDQDRASIEQLGFFKAVDVRAQPLEGENYRIVVDVSEFEIVKEVRVVGNTILTTEDILAAVPIKVGQPFNLSWQLPTAQAVQKLYADKGYIGGVLDIAPLDTSPATINLVVRESMVNSITIQGNTRTRDSVMRRLIKTRPGDPYNVRKFEDDLRRLYATQWFEKIEPQERPAENGFDVDLVVEVAEARTGEIVFGVTMDPRSSFAGNIRVADNNFRGTGQSVSLGLSQGISGVEGTGGDLDYTHPFIDRHDTRLQVSLYSKALFRFQGFFNDDTPTDERFSERRTGGAIALTRPLSSRLSASVGFRMEGINTSDVNTSSTNAFIQQDGTVAIGSMGLTLNRRDVDLDPARGDYASISFEPGFSDITRIGGAVNDPSILGRNNFWRSTLEYRAYWSPQPRRTRTELDAPRRVLAFRSRYGQINGKVPFFEQFFAGGSNTVRGYQDDRFWGKQMWLNSLEYRHPLQKSFSLIAFVDYGGAWGGYGSVNNFLQSDSFKLHLGYGLGASFKTPFGPLRLDFGFNEEGGSRTHFMIGTSF